jgi:uncharacterized protein
VPGGKIFDIRPALLYNQRLMHKIWQSGQIDLQFNVAQLLKEATGGTRTYEVEAQIMGDIDDTAVVVSPLTGAIKLLRTGPNIFVTGQLQCVIQKNCGRCLTTFSRPVEVELAEEFYPAADIVSGKMVPPPEDAEPANRIDEHNILDLTEVVRQELVVLADAVLYCQPACKGLCPHCGQDLNEVNCSCEDQPVNAGWASLLSTIHGEE